MSDVNSFEVTGDWRHIVDDGMVDGNNLPDEALPTGKVVFTPVYPQVAAAGTPATAYTLGPVPALIAAGVLTDLQGREGVRLAGAVGEHQVRWRAVTTLEYQEQKISYPSIEFELDEDMRFTGVIQQAGKALTPIVLDQRIEALAASVAAVDEVVGQVQGYVSQASGHVAAAAGQVDLARDEADRAIGLAGAQDEHIAGTLANPASATHAAFKAVGNATYATANELYVNVNRFGAVGDGAADDTLAIQTAIDHALVYGAGVFFPAGTYKATSPLRTYPAGDNPQTAGVKGAQFMGAGVRQSILQGVGTTLFHWAGDHLRIEKMRVVANGGHVFRQVGHVKWCVWDDIIVVQQSDGFSIYSHIEDLGNYLFNEWTATVTSYHTQTATVPTYHFRNSSPAGAVNANTFSLTPHRSGNYVFWFESGRDNNWVWDNVLREVRFEDTQGGCVKVLGGRRPVIQNCTVYDTLTSTRPLFHFGRGSNATNPSASIDPVFDNLYFAGITAGVDYIEFEQASPTVQPVTSAVLRGVRGTAPIPVNFGGNAASVVDSNLAAKNDVRVTYPGTPTVVTPNLGPNLVRGEKNNGLIYWTGATSILTATADGVVVNNNSGAAQTINVHMPSSHTASDLFMLTVKIRDIVNFPSSAFRYYDWDNTLVNFANSTAEQVVFTTLRSGSFLVLRINNNAQFTIEYARAQRVTGGVQFNEGGALKYRSPAGTITTLAAA